MTADNSATTMFIRLAVVVAVPVVLLAMVKAVQWARRGSHGAALVGSALMLLLGMGACGLMSTRRRKR